MASSWPWAILPFFGVAMKRIAIFCDGTWNRHDAPHPTNVVQLAQAVKLTASDGRKQQVFYKLGVGSGQGGNKLAKGMDRVLGGALGWGLSENIEDAYRDLIFCYEPGDEIHIFGFSRGAYTARSLAGLIRSCGIPPRENVGRVPDAIERYKSRDPKTKPDDPASFLFRADFAPFTATSRKEFNWRQKTKPGMCEIVKIAYVGVWDTVGALGVPVYWASASFLNKRYAFHDADLSRSVGAARHAVAIDERRRSFAPALWSNLDRLNGDKTDDRPYLQEWFPGDHGSVGGGGDRQGLSANTLEWVAEGAMKAGLEIEPVALEKAKQTVNVRENLVNHSSVGMMTKLMQMNSKDRAGPDRVSDVAQFTKDRVACDPSYQPKTLARVIGEIQRLIGRI